jgi:hypothetical protein
MRGASDRDVLVAAYHNRLDVEELEKRGPVQFSEGPLTLSTQNTGCARPLCG